MSVRCFVAVELAEALRRPVEKVIETLRAAGADAKWVEPQNLHFTLKFIGEIDEARVKDAAAGVERAVHGRPAFALSLAGVGAFPSIRAPRVVWIAVSSGAQELGSLAAAVEREMEAEGFPREKRPFSPHLTIGRVRSPRGGAVLSEVVSALAGREFGSMEVCSVRLMRSILRPSGPVYHPIRAWDLSR